MEAVDVGQFDSAYPENRWEVSRAIAATASTWPVEQKI
jgi:hypothetical protein